MQKARRHPDGLRPLVSVGFQVLFHSLIQGTFHLSLTVLVHYRSSRSIQPYQMVLVDSHRISRAPWYSGYYYDHNSYVYKAITLYRSTFQMIPLQIISRYCSPTTPTMPEHYRFGLVRFRSPLLTKSLLFSLPPGTQMFQFSGFALFRVTILQIAGFPHSEIYGSKDIAPPRSLSQLITSFIASRSQGIRPTLLITFLPIARYKFVLLNLIFSFQYVKELFSPFFNFLQNQMRIVIIQESNLNLSTKVEICYQVLSKSLKFFRLCLTVLIKHIIINK